jgi:hypothetical protein
MPHYGSNKSRDASARKASLYRLDDHGSFPDRSRCLRDIVLLSTEITLPFTLPSSSFGHKKQGKTPRKSAVLEVK